MSLSLGMLAVAGCSGDDSRSPDSTPTVDEVAVPTPMRARRSDEVCDAYALNTKTFYGSSVYSYTEAVIGLLQDLGVRTVRERLTTGSSPGALRQQYAMPRLARSGIRWHATVAELADWPNARAVTQDVMRMVTDYYLPAVDGDLSSLIHSFGGCNEVDGPVVNGAVDPAWADHARLMQTELWQQAKADPRTSSIPVAGPSTRSDVTRARALELGDLSAVCDWGNAHLYGRGTSPTRTIDAHIDKLRPCFPDASTWFFTETGYNNSPQVNAGHTVSEDAAATYALRGICDYFVRDCIYGRFELLDDLDDIDYSTQETINLTANREAHYGIVAVGGTSMTSATPDTWRKKPEFYATRRLLQLMADPGPAHTPEPLSLSIASDGSDLQQALVQKRDGRHYLLLWRDVKVAETYPEALPIFVERLEVTVRLRTRRPMAVFSPRHSETPVTRQPPRDSITVGVAGDLVVIQIG